MLDRLRRISKHIAFAVISNVLYGFIVYFVYRQLVGYSLMYVYIVTIILIIIALLGDEMGVKVIESKLTIDSIKKDKNVESAYKQVQWFFDSWVSFKTVLYVFYIFILIASQIIKFEPDLVGGSLKNFIIANEYSILILVAYDQLTSQFSKDRDRIDKVAEKVKKAVFETKD